MPARLIPPTVLHPVEDVPLPLCAPVELSASPPKAPATLRGRRCGVKPDVPGDDWSWDRTIEVMGR